MEEKIPHLTLSSCAESLKSESNSDTYISYLHLTFSVARSIFNVISLYYLYILMSVTLVLVLYGIYKSFWGHIFQSKELTDVGYDYIKPGPDRLAKINRVYNARQMGIKIPPPYPNGWFAVMEARDLGVTGVVPVDVLGQNLCVYRGEDGVARCVDAYCPHLGANIGIGGTVSGNCIECPFHKWKFGEDGVCVSVPGIEHAPRGVSIKTWTTVEAHGVIWIWHDAEGREPQYPMQDSPELKTWGYRGRNEFIISAHIQDVSENAADMAHINVVHGPSVVSNLGVKYPRLHNIIGHHVWSAQLTYDKHTNCVDLKHDYRMLNMNVFHIDVKVDHSGPSFGRVFFQSPVGPVLLIHSITPIGPLLQKMVQRFYSPFYNAPLVSSFINTESTMVERDVVIWNRKKFMATPPYVRTDKSTREFRSWYSQFYSEKSTSFQDAIKNPLDW